MCGFISDANGTEVHFEIFCISFVQAIIYARDLTDLSSMLHVKPSCIMLFCTYLHIIFFKICMKVFHVFCFSLLPLICYSPVTYW